MRTYRIPAALICLALLAGCADGCASMGGSTPPSTVPDAPTAAQTMVEQQWTATNLIFYARVARRQIALGVGGLEGSGVITTAQADAIEPMGNAVDALLDPIEQSLRLWMAVGGEPNAAEILASSAKLRKSLLDLVSAAGKLGIEVKL